MSGTSTRAATSVVAALLAAAAAAQGVNPEISVVGDVRAFVNDNAADPDEGELQLDLESVEVALQGYLNPYARADVYIAYHDEELSVEEAYASILRGLPWGLQVRAGKYRVDFGKLNLLHPHAYSFLDTPLPHQELLGEEGLVDIGANLDTQVPVGNAALTLSVNLLKGDFAEPHHHHEDKLLLSDEDEGEELDPGLGTSERIALFVPTGDYAGFEVGVNALQGTLDEPSDRRVDLLGADVKYRWAPDRYRSLTLQAEWLRSERDVLHQHEPGADPELEQVRAGGYYAFADWRFAQRWNLGAILEATDLAEEEGVSVERYGAFAGFQVMEETTMLRLLVRRTDHDKLSEPYHEVVLQLVFSLGPHQAHWF